MANQSVAIPLAAGTGSGTVVTGACSFRGFWLATSGAATVTIYDNTAASGTILAVWTTAGAADKEFDISDGQRCEKGIYVNVSAGTISGNVRIG